ncbi:hypothetical protein D4R86_00415 [bacterium]|nr:MAG: hypothetical protein D4R86_00415 [bacterium]
MSVVGNLIQWYGPPVQTDWNATHVYRAATEDGVYELVETVSPISTTSYWDIAGVSTDYYKIAFYNTTTLVEGTQSAAIYATSTTPLYITPTELRKFMQFSITDFPNDEDVTLMLETANTHLTADKGSITNAAQLKLLSLFLGASYVCRSLATRALSKGYISVSLQGGNIMKAHNELIRLAEYYYEKYQEFMAKETVDYAATSFLGRVDVDTAQEIKDIMNGVSDGFDVRSSYRPSVNNRSAR